MAFSLALPSSPCRFVFEVFLDLSCFCYRIYNLIKLHFISNNLRYVSSLIELHWKNFKGSYYKTASSVCHKGELALSSCIPDWLPVKHNSGGVCLSAEKSWVAGLTHRLNTCLIWRADQLTSLLWQVEVPHTALLISRNVEVREHKLIRLDPITKNTDVMDYIAVHLFCIAKVGQYRKGSFVLVLAI